MFRTQPAAEIKMPVQFTPFGEQTWSWVELPIQIPFFLLAMTVETDEGQFGQHFVFSRVKDMMRLIASTTNAMDDMTISLLSPQYMNGSGEYQLDRIKQIWRSSNGRDYMFIVENDTTMYFPPKEDDVMDPNMELLVSI